MGARGPSRGPSRGPESPSNLGVYLHKINFSYRPCYCGQITCCLWVYSSFFRQMCPSYLYQTKEAELSRPLSCCSASSHWILHTSRNFLLGMHSIKAGFPSLRESLVSVVEGLWTPFLCVTKIFNWSQDYPY